MRIDGGVIKYESGCPSHVNNATRFPLGGTQKTPKQPTFPALFHLVSVYVHPSPVPTQSYDFSPNVFPVGR